VSVLYCTIPHFAVALAQRDDPALTDRPLVLVGPEGACLTRRQRRRPAAVSAGMTARAAEVRCPEARLVEADVARCRAELDGLFQVLERASPKVEPHGWGAAYADLGDMARDWTRAAGLLADDRPGSAAGAG